MSGGVTSEIKALRRRSGNRCAYNHQIENKYETQNEYGTANQSSLNRFGEDLGIIVFKEKKKGNIR